MWGGPTAQSLAQKVQVPLLRKAVGLQHSLQNGLEELDSVHMFILQWVPSVCLKRMGAVDVIPV